MITAVLITTESLEYIRYHRDLLRTIGDPKPDLVVGCYAVFIKDQFIVIHPETFHTRYRFIQYTPGLFAQVDSVEWDIDLNVPMYTKDYILVHQTPHTPEWRKLAW